MVVTVPISSKPRRTDLRSRQRRWAVDPLRCRCQRDSDDGPIAGLRDTELQAVIEQERLTESRYAEADRVGRRPVCAARIERSARRAAMNWRRTWSMCVRTRCQLYPLGTSSRI